MDAEYARQFAARPVPPVHTPRPARDQRYWATTPTAPAREQRYWTTAHTNNTTRNYYATTADNLWIDDYRTTTTPVRITVQPNPANPREEVATRYFAGSGERAEAVVPENQHERRAREWREAIRRWQRAR